MSIDPTDFRVFVIDPALSALAAAGIPVTRTAADLLMATAAVETNGGDFLIQAPDGPALGVFQDQTIETLAPLLTSQQVAALYTIMPRALATGMNLTDWIKSNICGNMILAAAICRLHYWFATPDPLPADTLSGLWNYYHVFYNSVLGATTQERFLEAVAEYTDLGGLPP